MKIFNSIIFIFLFSMVFSQLKISPPQYNKIQIKAKCSGENKNDSLGFKIFLYEISNANEKKIIDSANGAPRHLFNLELSKKYRFLFYKPEYISKEISFSTIDVPDESIEKFSFTVELEHQPKDSIYSYLFAVKDFFYSKETHRFETKTSNALEKRKK